MTLEIEHSLPEWLIDDTADISNARVFVYHAHEPRFVGELLSEDEAEISGITFSCPNHEVLCRIAWIDDPVFDAKEMTTSLWEAIKHHFDLR